LDLSNIQSIIFIFIIRTLLDQTVAELKHQVSLLRTRESKVMEQNRELQHTMLDLESKLEEMHDRSQTAIEMVGITINFVIVGHG
jgi:regulator of replication initiation timing